MTQAMLPTQPGLNSPNSTPKAATKNQLPDEFSGTLRDQLDGQREGRTDEKSVDNASALDSTADEQSTDAPSATANLAVESAHGHPSSTQSSAPVTDPNIILLTDGVQGMAAELQLTADPALMTELSGAVVPIVDITQGAAVVTPATDLVRAQASASVGQMRATRKAVGAADAPGIEHTPRATSATIAQGNSASARSGVEKDLFAQNFVRFSNEAVESIPVQSRPTLAPVIAPVIGINNTVLQNAVAPAPPSPMQSSVDIPLASANWGSVIGARLVWGLTQGVQSASIDINPRELGPLSVNLTMSDDEASVRFVSQHVLVREAIEAALPRLRELFAGEGITLGDVDISSGEGRSNGGGDATSHDEAHTSAQSNDALGFASKDERVRVLDTLVDTFA